MALEKEPKRESVIPKREATSGVALSAWQRGFADAYSKRKRLIFSPIARDSLYKAGFALGRQKREREKKAT